jgi:hypothetical protein
MRLDVALMRHRRAEFTLEDHIGLSKSPIHVTTLQLHPAGDIRLTGRVGRRLACRDEIGVQDRRIGRNRALDAADRFQRLIGDVDAAGRVACDVERRRRDGRDGMAMIERFVMCQQVVSDIVKVVCAFTDRELGGGFWNILSSDHCLDARPGFRRRGVNGHDPRVRMRTAQHEAIQHAGQRKVRAVIGTAGHFVQSVVPDGTCPDVRISVVAHTAAFLISAAASNTARMILS